MARTRKPASSFALAVKAKAEPGVLMSGTDKARAATAPDPIIAEARDFWNRCDEAENTQRESILAAKKFRAGDQWPTAIRLQREGSSAIQGQAAQPPRPCLTIDRLSPPVRQVSNQIKTANFAIDVLPNGFGADQETADIYKGYLRRVQNQAREESPVEWAADGAIEGGLGWFRIRTEYVHETWDGDPNAPEVYDQELRMERIANNLSVYCDPAANKPTRSDAQRMIVTEDLSKDDFLSRWPKADLQGIEDFCATGDMKGWISDDSVRIGEYWRITYQDVIFPAPEGQKPRVMRKPIVKGYKISATEVLESWDWVGSRIPLIPILGEELNVDGKPVLRGIIQPGMDAQRMINYTYSGAVELFALGNQATYVVEENQIADYQQIWQNRTQARYSYLPYRAVPTAPPPHLEATEAPIQGGVELMRVSEESVKATTGYFDSGLGANDNRILSGKAKQSEIQRSDLGSSNYPDNVRRALIYAGALMIEIMPKITRPGQILQIIGHDDEPEQVMIGQPFQKGPDGRPVAVPGMTPEQAKLSKGMAQFYDLKNGKYAVTVDVGKASATKREEGAAALGELLPHMAPPQQMAIMPDYVRQLSFPGAQKIAEKLEKTMPPELQAMLKSDDGEQPDPQMLQQQVQALTAQLQQATQIIQTKQAEQQGKIAATQIAESAESERAALDRQADLQKANIAATAQVAVAEIRTQNEDLDRRLKLLEIFLTKQQEDRLDRESQGHEHLRQDKDHAHEAALTVLEHEQARQLQAEAPRPTNNGIESA